MTTITIIRDYLLECAQENKWTEDKYVMGYTTVGMQSGMFIRYFGSHSIYEQTLSWTSIGEKLALRKTSVDGLYHMDTISVNLCDPNSLEAIKLYFVD